MAVGFLKVVSLGSAACPPLQGAANLAYEIATQIKVTPFFHTFVSSTLIAVFSLQNFKSSEKELKEFSDYVAIANAHAIQHLQGNTLRREDLRKTFENLQLFVLANDAQVVAGWWPIDGQTV